MGDLRQREPRIEIPAILQLANGAPCMFRFPGICRGDASTTVACHSNSAEDGKAVGGKGHDLFVAYGCSACHDWHDTQSRRSIPSGVGYIALVERDAALREREATFNRAMKATLAWLYREGHLRIVR